MFDSGTVATANAAEQLALLRSLFERNLLMSVNAVASLLRSRVSALGLHVIHVVGLSSGKEMVGIHTERSITSVADHGTIWNRSVRQLIGESMGENVPMSPARNLSVSIRSLCSEPEETSRVRLRNRVFPKPRGIPKTPIVRWIWHKSSKERRHESGCRPRNTASFDEQIFAEQRPTTPTA